VEERRDANAVAPRRLSPRARLLDAALELFGTAGYEATSIGALCREAKVSTRDFYRHVGDRMQLFLAVFEREVERILGPVAAAMDEAEPVLAVRTRMWAEHWLRTILDDPRRYRIMYTEAIGVSPELDRRRREVLHSSCALSARQFEVCGAVRGQSRPAGYYELAGVATMGAAREVLMQFFEGQVSVADSDMVLEAVVHLATMLGEGW
jgi:AcrR family transcriptional regulator